MRQRLGSCSICNGDVMGHVGAWHSVLPPPPPECSSCGARTRDDVIAMVPKPSYKTFKPFKDSSGNGLGLTNKVDNYVYERF